MGGGFDELTAEGFRGIADMFGLRSAIDGGMFFCGVSQEEFAINGVTYAWPRGSRLTWGLGFSRLGALSDMDVKDVVTQALREISDCCDVTHAYIANADAANLRIITQRLDGPSGVLADCQIPVGNVAVDRTSLLMRLDDSEAWGIYDAVPPGKIDFYRVFLHEAEHFHGLGHKPANISDEALIAPMYNPRIRHLQPADKAELVRRYGLPTKLPPPMPVPAAKPKVKVSVTMPDGVTFEANGEMHKV